jgi:hypothetical protein
MWFWFADDQLFFWPDFAIVKLFSTIGWHFSIHTAHSIGELSKERKTNTIRLNSHNRFVVDGQILVHIAKIGVATKSIAIVAC